MDILKITGILFLSALTALILKRTGSILCTASVCAGAVFALFFCVPKISDIVNTAIAMINDSGVSEYFPIVLKVAVVSIICDLASDLCCGCESPTLAKAVTVAGKFEMIFISLPLFTELYRFASSFVKGS